MYRYNCSGAYESVDRLKKNPNFFPPKFASFVMVMVMVMVPFPPQVRNFGDNVERRDHEIRATAAAMKTGTDSRDTKITSGLTHAG